MTTTPAILTLTADLYALVDRIASHASDAESGNVAQIDMLKAEVQRLKAAIAEMARWETRERTRIVVWLRENSGHAKYSGPFALEDAAIAIENGEHLK